MLTGYINELKKAIKDNNKKACLYNINCLIKCGMDYITIYTLLAPTQAQQLRMILLH